MLKNDKKFVDNHFLKNEVIWVSRQCCYFHVIMNPNKRDKINCACLGKKRGKLTCRNS